MPNFNNLTILLVEDDQDDVELMQDALQDNGVNFTMDIVRQGDKVLPYLKSCKKFPNIILLDLNLPKMHGREVLSRIKLSEEFKHIPVAILTTSSSQSEKEFCLSAGATDFLTKPSTVEGFNKTIESIVKIAQQAQTQKS
ncbi:response regulator [Chryseolinea sp. H1M3-3]|uniref:response regulator n=1 Tax=Chryseolinea sp. H1M3-3 TaxID=3034144 RepID=UPI0023EB0C19|nr:response regulator [Chryseolinea sp. H1M3-3]